MFLSHSRVDELFALWCEETSDPDSQEWRDELTEQEESLVSGWDKAYCRGIKSLCEQILHHEEQVVYKHQIPEFHV